MMAVPLGDGMFRVPTLEDVGPAADEAEEVETIEADDNGEVSEFGGRIYAFSFPMLMRQDERFPIKVGMTAADVDVRVTTQCRSSAAFDTPIVLGRWRVSRVSAVEMSIHQTLKARGQWREHAPGTEWFDAKPTEIEAIVKFITQE